ncbi:factor-independent urate hydroxylase [Stackebrandtia nassauensis]|uniref:Uricase n=1 Tax=Stackebrandtia nassauensis (strain DSM 44728 / CIP 108903 / NRRL B-16338 / NBRC 102104 / LLR-40K-21) TaxID=446470 RepID=D3Q644_STANL|nr:urate oxidase [Stackebrandtia nassauensis]ADD42219.1 urate oxidase [Stackebrandtia nassauensis DSM 44728]
MARLDVNQYGKAETRVVRLCRDTPRHEIRDLNVSIALSGDLTDVHLSGDNSHVVPTDTQKNTVYAFARAGIDQVETFGLRLARHFVDEFDPIHGASVDLDEYAWQRVGDHSFSRGSGGETRTAHIGYDGDVATVSAGLKDLLLLNSTDSEFTGYIKDRYTTLPETKDRILATAVSATWVYASDDLDFTRAFADARGAVIAAFADTYSLSLQQTLYSIGERVLSAVPEVTEVSLSLPNKHHFVYDLSPFGLDNPGLVFNAADRPYGLIEGTVKR